MKKALCLLAGLHLFLMQGNQVQAQTKFHSPADGVYVVETDSSADVFTYTPARLETVEKAAAEQNVSVGINAGFFDPANKLTTSYVYRNGFLLADPLMNQSLTGSTALKPYLDKILNRSEFRILSCKGTKKFDIARHNAHIDNGCALVDSVQAGPELLSEESLSEEAFVVRKDNRVIKESASTLSRHARSAIGIKGNKVYIVAASYKAPMTIKELSKYMKALGVEKAMAFDGGSSTSLYINLPEQKFNLTSAKDNSARKVKSMLFIK